MAHGTVNVRLRPIKLAFLVHPNDKASLRKAIEINTFLWGGMYNPIIPTYRRIPKRWGDRFLNNNPNAQDVLLGYLDNFDPDYVVPMGECSGYSFDVGNRRKIDDVSEFLEPVEEDGTPKYGIGLFEVLNHFIHRELKFQRRDPVDICVPCFGLQHRTFLASVFGTLSENINTIFWERFAGALDAKKTDCTDSNYVEILNARKLFLRRITHYNLRAIRSRWSWEQCIFLLDATNSLDIMDYWNLRAIGWDIIPIPKQFAQYDNTKQCALDFIEANHVPRDSNPEIYHHTAILRSRSISEDEHKNFVDALDVPKPDEPSKRSKVVIDPSYPRIWDEWARHYDRVECCNLEARTVEHDISPDQDTIRFKTLDPKCIGGFAGHSEARFANEIDLRLYDDKELLAEVIPQGSWELARVISFDAFDWRLSRKGLVYLSRHRKWEISFTIPQAEAVVTKWLNLRGWKVALSPAGRIAKQMIRQLGGTIGTWTLAKKGIIQLLEEMNSSDGKSISESHLHGTIAKIVNQTGSKRTAKIIFQRLVERKVFQLGMEIQCPVCAESSWYSVKSADYELQCPKCLAQLAFPSVSKDIKWSYRTLGPFSLPKQAQGAYAVLLTLRFFSTPRLLDGAITPLMSFITKKGRMKELEADFALFF